VKEVWEVDKKKFNRIAEKWSIARCEMTILSGGIFPAFKSMIQENRKDQEILCQVQTMFFLGKIPGNPKIVLHFITESNYTFGGSHAVKV
jgi:hypothetical protein